VICRKRAKGEDGAAVVAGGGGKGHEVGEKVWVKWRDGGFQQAEIIDRREKEQRGAGGAGAGGGRKDKEGTSSSSSSSSVTKKDPFQYYVHYVEFNRRLDEWINADRIVSDDEALKKKDGGQGAAPGAAGSSSAPKESKTSSSASASSSSAAANEGDDHHHHHHHHDEDPGAPERKLTRKMKRQHDEINHVQKVTALSFPCPVPSTPTLSFCTHTQDPGGT